MKVSFIGYGNVAKAMIKGLLDSGMLSMDDIFTSDRDEDNQAAADFADYIFLTIKPNMYNHVLSNLVRTENKVFITVAPGIKTSSINAKVIRTMPNTPALVGAGVTTVCRGANVTDTEFECVKKMLSTFSEVYEFEESLMDYTVALSGSGPAYAYLFMDAMANFGAKCGIEYEVAKKMMAQTMLGAARMVLESDESPKELCDKVCTKGGATIKAVQKLHDFGFDDMMREAMEACAMRAVEMGEM